MGWGISVQNRRPDSPSSCNSGKKKTPGAKNLALLCPWDALPWVALWSLGRFQSMP